jgi:methylase of polypeptide subunit release factors
MDASILSKKYYDKYGLNINQINTSTFNNLTFSLENSTIKPEIIFFNPPYVPVEQEEIDNEHKYLVSKLKCVRE